MTHSELKEIQLIIHFAYMFLMNYHLLFYPKCRDIPTDENTIKTGTIFFTSESK